MKRLLTITTLLILIPTILSNTTFAQFGAASGPVIEAIHYGQSADAASIANAQQFAVKSPSQLAAASANLHRKFFNLAARDSNLEQQVSTLITPTLTKLNLTARISVLVIQDDVIPYARISRDGVFVMTTCLARGMAGFRYPIGFLLREIARLQLLNEYGAAVARGDAASLQLVDLKITAGAIVLAQAAGVPTNEVRNAIVAFNTRVPGTQPTYETDRHMFAGVFVVSETNAKTVPPLPTTGGKLGRFLNVVNNTTQAVSQSNPRPVVASNRRAEDLHTRGTDRANTSDHEKVIAAVGATQMARR